MYDLIIIGAGPAGVTAAVYASRKRMNFIVIADDIGGQMTWSGDIENYTGYQFVTGVELVSKFEEHIKKYGVLVREFERVVLVEKNSVNDCVTVLLESGEKLCGRTVLIASGKRSRMLNIPGEIEFRRKGVTYCATCDGPLYADKDVAVVGGGNSGLEAVLQLQKIANRVYLLDMNAALTGDAILIEKVQRFENVIIMHNARVREIAGSNFVEKITVEHEDEIKEINVSGVFVEIGLVPNSEFTKGINKNQQNEIMVNNCNQTNVPSIFAAGDVTDVPEKQIIIAAGEGAKACLTIFNYLVRQK